MYLLKCLKSQGLPAKQLSVLDTLLKSNNWLTYWVIIKMGASTAVIIECSLH